MLIEAFTAASADWQDEASRRLKAVLSTLSISVAGVSVQAAGEEPRPSSSLGRQLQEALTQLAEDAAPPGVVLLIDEVQSADAEGLRALAYAWQHLQSEAPQIPLIGYCAGLSHTQDVITDAVSFAERFHYRHLENLDDEASAAALVDAAERKGVSWDGPALGEALERADGYPYFLQLIGDEAWKAADYPDAGSVITQSHIVSAEREFRSAQESFFRSRWTKATDLEQQFMIAMAAEGADQARRGEVASRMNRTTQAISMVRRSLMDKGLVDAPSHGFIQFTAPGFGEFVRRETGLLD